MSLQLNPVVGPGLLARQHHEFASHSRIHSSISMQIVSHNIFHPIAYSTGLYQLKGNSKRDVRQGRTLTYSSKNKNVENLTHEKEEKSNGSTQELDISVNTSNSFSTSVAMMKADEKSQPQAATSNLLETDGKEGANTSSKTATQRIEAHDGSMPNPNIASSSSPVTSDASRIESPVKSQQSPFASGKLSLSAQEKLRTARTLTGFAESDKPVNSLPGKSIIDALRESDKLGKTTKYGQPIEPSNLFDDRKGGSSAEWGKFEFSLGPGQLYVFLSFLLISSIMFGTTYFVWKVGAIHYNEF